MSDIELTLPGIKRGDTFTATWSLPLAFGETISGILAQVNQSNGDEIEDLTITPLDDTEDYKVWRLSATASQTQTWPVKTLRFDIKHIAVDDSIVHSDTIALPVRKAETP